MVSWIPIGVYRLYSEGCMLGVFTATWVPLLLSSLGEHMQTSIYPCAHIYNYFYIYLVNVFKSLGVHLILPVPLQPLGVLSILPCSHVSDSDSEKLAPAPIPSIYLLIAQAINYLLSVTNLLSTPATSTTCHLCPSSLEPGERQFPRLCKEPLLFPLCLLRGKQLQDGRGNNGEVEMTGWYEGRPLLLKRSEDGFSLIG